MTNQETVAMRYWLLGTFALFLLSGPVMAQDLQRHGDVVQVRGETVEVRLAASYEDVEGALGIVFARNEVGGREQTVPVARIEAETVTDGVATGQIVERMGGIGLQEGFGVAFQGVQRDLSMDEVTPGVLRLSSSPTGARVQVQSLRPTATGRTLLGEPNSLGTTPLVDSLLPGRYRLTLRKEGFTPTRRSLILAPDSVTADTVHMEGVEGTLVVDAKPDRASVFVDGLEIGQGRVEQAVDAGERVVRVDAEGYEAAAETLSVAPDAEHTLNVSLDPKRGTLAVSSLPNEATVRVDGTEIGRTPVTVERPPGTYEVQVEANRYEAYTENVTVQPEAETSVNAQLQRPLQVQLAGSHGSGVHNVQMERDDDWIVVHYDLQDEADEYDVTLELSDELGQSFPTEPETIRGDVGEEVSAGAGKVIRWAALEDFPRGLEGENYRLRIAADPAGGNGVLYVLGSLLVGGGATAAILTLQGGEGQGEIPTPPAPPN